MDFGSRIRSLRKEKDISLRELSERVGMDFTYLSKIENGKVEPPSEQKIRAIASELEVGAEELLALSGKVSSNEIRKAVQGNPSVGVLLRKIQSRSLSKQQIARMLKIATDDDE